MALEQGDVDYVESRLLQSLFEFIRYVLRVLQRHESVMAVVQLGILLEVVINLPVGGGGNLFKEQFPAHGVSRRADGERRRLTVDWRRKSRSGGLGVAVM
jgi:hypothetical protein